MAHSDPTIMLRFSATRHVFSDEPVATGIHRGQMQLIAVTHVEWFTKHGDTETSCSEHWKLVAPNIWQAISPKK